MHRHKHWTHLWWAILQRFGVESYRTWVAEVLSTLAGGLAGAITEYFRSHGHSSFTDALLNGSIGAGIVFGIYATVNLFRSVWLEHKSETRGTTQQGVGGTVVTLALVGAIALGVVLTANDIRTTPIILGSADPGHKKADDVVQLEECRSNLAAFTMPESKDSLRRRTVRLAAEIDKFWNDQPPQPGGPPNNPATEEEKKRVQVWEQYWRDMRSGYDLHSFQEKVAEIVGAYQTKNIPVGNLEWSIKYNRMIGGTMYRGDGETPPQVLCGTDTCLLRELAFHVNARDEVITLDF